MVDPLCECVIRRVTEDGQTNTIIDHVGYLVKYVQDPERFQKDDVAPTSAQDLVSLGALRIQ